MSNGGFKKKVDWMVGEGWIGEEEGEEEEILLNPEPYRFDLVPPSALMGMAVVMAEGLKDHAPDGWRKISVLTHVGRAMGHMVRWRLGGEGGENHLAHALCRLAFAHELSQWDPAHDIPEAPRVQPQGCSGPSPGIPEAPADAPATPSWASSQFVYLAYPYSGDPNRNTAKATILGDKLQYQLNQGKEWGSDEVTFVLIPHNFCCHMSEELERPLILKMCKKVVGLCSHLYLGGHTITEGMRVELAEARRLGIPVSIVHDHGSSLGFSDLEGEE